MRGSLLYFINIDGLKFLDMPRQIAYNTFFLLLQLSYFIWAENNCRILFIKKIIMKKKYIYK